MKKTIVLSKAERTRLNIIEKSASLFNRKGYSGTSLKDIMIATGLSKGGLYGHFRGGKEEIAESAFEFAVQSVYHKVGIRTRQVENTIDKLKEVIYFYREHIFHPPVEGGCPIQNTSIEADDNQPALRKRVVRAIEEWSSRITYTLNKGIQRGEIRPDINVEELATYYIGSIEGGIMLARIQKDEQQFDIMTRPLLVKLEDIRA
jgi:TetR/AcrR family transcriptional repressor of nem operon